MQNGVWRWNEPILRHGGDSVERSIKEVRVEGQSGGSSSSGGASMQGQWRFNGGSMEGQPNLMPIEL